MPLKQRNIWLEMTKGKESIGKQDCPFCKQEDDRIIIKEFNYWKIWLNKYPYNGIKKHLLVIPKAHKEHTKDLSKKEFAELKDIEKFMSDYYAGENYFSFIRETNGGKSIKHLHYHFIPGILYSDKLEDILQK